MFLSPGGELAVGDAGAVEKSHVRDQDLSGATVYEITPGGVELLREADVYNERNENGK